MLARFLRRGFAGHAYRFGPLSDKASLESPGDSAPLKFTLPSDEKVSKVSFIGQNPLIMSEKGRLFRACETTKGSCSPIESVADAKEFADFDTNEDYTVFLAKNGDVFGQNRSGEPQKIDLRMKPKFVTAAAKGGIAVAEDDRTGHSHVFAWSPRISKARALFADHVPHSDKQGAPFELKKVSALINQKHSRVRKLKAVENAAVVLLENGELISWGDNANGNLGVPRSELSLVHNHVAAPAEPLALNKLSVKVADFDLSDNVLVLLSADGRAFYCGLNNVLKLREIPFFPGQKVRKVGACFNHFFLQGEDGHWYSNQPLEGPGLVKFFGDLNLYRVDPRCFGAERLESISGKFAVPFAS